MEQMDSGTGASPVDVILGIRKELAEFQRANSADDSADDSGGGGGGGTNGGGGGGNGRTLRAALRAAYLAALRRQLENPAPTDAVGTGVGSAGVVVDSAGVVVVDGEASGDDYPGRRRRRLPAGSLALSRLDRRLLRAGAPDASADEEILDMIRELEWGSLMADTLQRVHQRQRQRQQRRQQRREIARAKNTAANLLPGSY
jgi:hypothetical protein